MGAGTTMMPLTGRNSPAKPTDSDAAAFQSALKTIRESQLMNIIIGRSLNAVQGLRRGAGNKPGDWHAWQMLAADAEYESRGGDRKWLQRIRRRRDDEFTWKEARADHALELPW